MECAVLCRIQQKVEFDDLLSALCKICYTPCAIHHNIWYLVFVVYFVLDYWSYNYFLLPMLEAGYSLAAADLLTFWMWALLQEWVFTIVVGTFYPALLGSCVVFGLMYYSVPFTDKGSLKYFHNKEQASRDTVNGENGDFDGDMSSGFWTTLLWIVLFLQNGFIITLYAREWYA